MEFSECVNNEISNLIILQSISSIISKLNSLNLNIKGLRTEKLFNSIILDYYFTDILNNIYKCDEINFDDEKINSLTGEEKKMLSDNFGNMFFEIGLQILTPQILVILLKIFKETLNDYNTNINFIIDKGYSLILKEYRDKDLRDKNILKSFAINLVNYILRSITIVFLNSFAKNIPNIDDDDTKTLKFLYKYCYSYLKTFTIKIFISLINNIEKINNPYEQYFILNPLNYTNYDESIPIMFHDESALPESGTDTKRRVTKIVKKSQLMPLLSPNDDTYKSNCYHLKPDLNTISNIFDVLIGNITTIEKLKNLPIITQLKTLETIINCFSDNINNSSNATDFLARLKTVSSQQSTLYSKITNGFTLVYQCVPIILTNTYFWKALYDAFSNTNDSINEMDWTEVNSEPSSPRSSSLIDVADVAPQDTSLIDAAAKKLADVAPQDTSIPSSKDTDWMWDWSGHHTNEEN